MFFLIFIITLIAIYIASFKDNFKKENLEKSLPVIILFTLVVFILCIVASISRGV